MSETDERNTQVITFPPVPSSETLLALYVLFYESVSISSVSPLLNTSSNQSPLDYHSDSSNLSVGPGWTLLGG